MTALTGRETALVDIARLLEQKRDEIGDLACSRILDQVPSYRGNPDPRVPEQLSVHCRAVFQHYLDALLSGHPPSPDAFQTTAETALHRVSQGIGLPDFMRAFRVAQLAYWEQLLGLAPGCATPEALLAAVAPLMEVIERGSTAAAGAYLEAQQHMLADVDRVNRDLIEDLLAAREPAIGPRRAALTAAGLHQDSRLVVLSATTEAFEDEERTVRLIRSILSRAMIRTVRGVFAVRHAELVGIIPVAADPQRSLDALQQVREALRKEGVDLAIGVSTVHHGLGAVPEAYREGVIARGALGATGGLMPLSSVPAFDFLILNGAGTAQRLLDPSVKAFVEEDLRTGRIYLDTLDAYVECDLNAKRAAKRLHLHANTVYYRLERIAERTNKDLHRLSEVLAVLVASRLLSKESAEPTVLPPRQPAFGPSEGDYR